MILSFAGLLGGGGVGECHFAVCGVDALDADLCADALAQVHDVADDAHTASAHLVEALEGTHHEFAAAVVEGAEAFVDEQGVGRVDVFAGF